MNVVEDGVDVAIRIGTLPDSGLIARRLGQTRRVLVASPAYLDANGVPAHPEDLARHRLIGFTALTPGSEWGFRDLTGNPLRVAVAPYFATNAGDAAIAQAAAGGGITAALCYQVADALVSGALSEVLAAFRLPPLPIQAVYPSSRLLSGKVRAFLTLAEQDAAGWRFGRD